MSREILFRGKTLSGEWIQGSLDQSQQTGRGEVLIRTNDMELYWNSKMVIPETVGQFTGLTDKNGVKVFEGDKIIYHHSPTKLVDVESHEIDPYKKQYQREDDEGLVIVQQYRKIDKVIKIKGVVNFTTLSGVDISFKNNANYHWWDNVENIEVIGNIHDEVKNER